MADTELQQPAMRGTPSKMTIRSLKTALDALAVIHGDDLPVTDDYGNQPVLHVNKNCSLPGHPFERYLMIF